MELFYVHTIMEYANTEYYSLSPSFFFFFFFKKEHDSPLLYTLAFHSTICLEIFP